MITQTPTNPPKQTHSDPLPLNFLPSTFGKISPSIICSTNAIALMIPVITPAERTRTASTLTRIASDREEVEARALRIEFGLRRIVRLGRTAKTTRRRGALTEMAMYWRFRRRRG